MKEKKKRVSKKNKSSWRKHVDVKDVDDFLEDQRLEERLGEPFSALKDEELFTVTTEVKEKQLSSKEKKRLRLLAPPKCFSMLQSHTKVPDPIKKRNRVRSKKERMCPILKKKEHERRLNGIFKPREMQSMIDRYKHKDEKLQEKEQDKFCKDIWDVEDQLNDDWLEKNTKRHTLRGLGKLNKIVPKMKSDKNVAIANVEIPHPGMSYNPSFKDHNDLLMQIVEKETKIMKQEAHIQRVTKDMFRRVPAEQTQSSWMIEMSQGLPENATETDEDLDNVADDTKPYKSVNAAVVNKKKTSKQRRKQKEQLKLREQLLLKKLEKKKTADLHKLKVIKQQIESLDRKLVKQRERKEKLKSFKKNEPKQLGRLKYEDPDIEFSMPENLTGNLRNVKSEGNLLADRFHSMQKRNILPVTVRHNRKKMKVRKFVKPGFKDDWKKTVASSNIFPTKSVQMRLYTMHKREFVMVFIAFFGCLGLGIFIGMAGPPITSTSEIDGKSLLMKDNKSHTIGNEIASGPFTMRSPSMTTYSQQMWLIGKLTTDNYDDEIIDKSFQISTSIEGLTEDHKPVVIIDSDHSRNRTRHLRCVKEDCDEFIILHLGFLDYTHYIITVNFYDLEGFHQRYNIKELKFYFKTYNPAFTQIEIWFRFIFLMATFFITCWFAHTLKKYAIFDWSIEQKWMSVLLPLLLFYNNPVFPMTFLINSWIPGMIDALSQATFLSALLLFWLCVYHGLRQNERRLLTFYFPKFFVVGMLWISAVIMATWEKCNELKDPTYNHAVDTTNYYALKVFFFTFGGIYVAYLLLLVLRAYSELRSMPFFDMRLKFLTLLMLVVLAISLTITILRFGIGVLEDNFVAQLSTHYNSSVQFMSFYGLLNFYIYAMAYVYSPNSRSLLESSITKDNPAFSMINDSDEEVIYGSDEESRRPLNRSRNDDDSD